MVQSTRAYRPSHVTHYQTSWVGDPSWPEPTWPGQMADGEWWDRERRAQHYAPWIAFHEQVAITQQCDQHAIDKV